MSLTYPPGPTEPIGDRIETPRADLARQEPFVPVYARRGKARSGKGKLKTWMILVPIGVLTLGGIGAMMAMNGGDEASVPLVEPAATLPVLSTPPVSPGSEVAPLSNPTPAPVISAPSVREAAPTPRAAPVAAAPAATPDPVVATGPQPYAPAPTAPAPPVIIVEPVG